MYLGPGEQYSQAKNLAFQLYFGQSCLFILPKLNGALSTM